ncbi:single-stranded DNA-binding protein [Lactobacillus sp. PV034]|uniref:single-stranded DNA-binding protein n=1 Tax=Lactobacillus sp. PV034 TaxID=2594495 RepID=UPI0022404C70|nr:single-stranded DNA-binding protein [Lactobacillus sp. PV034]QNQ80806.1 single-stranded DNA-binding protein [Lactobacillus sp. PV034]
MSLADALNQIKKENYDPKKDKPGSGFERIPDGEYIVSLSGATHGVWPNSQTDFIRFSLEVATGDEAGRQEFFTPTLAETTSKGKKMPAGVLTRNIKQIQRLGAMVGLDPVPDECFLQETESEDYEKLQDAFQPYKGKLLKLTIKTTENKKDPDRPYRNLEFDEVEQPKAIDPNAAKATGVTVTDDDLPF